MVAASTAFSIALAAARAANTAGPPFLRLADIKYRSAQNQDNNGDNHKINGFHRQFTCSIHISFLPSGQQLRTDK